MNYIKRLFSAFTDFKSQMKFYHVQGGIYLTNKNTLTMLFLNCCSCMLPYTNSRTLIDSLYRYKIVQRTQVLFSEFEFKMDVFTIYHAYSNEYLLRRYLTFTSIRFLSITIVVQVLLQINQIHSISYNLIACI